VYLSKEKKEFPVEAPMFELTITKPKSFDVFTTVTLRMWPSGL
jgi:hypothetical protein